MTPDPFAPHDAGWVRRYTDSPVLHVGAVLHKYPPIHNAGGEWMAHEMLSALVAAGHTVTVWLPGDTGPGSFGPVTLERYAGAGAIRDAGVDLLVTHLDLTRTAVDVARTNGTPLVHLVHNHRQLKFHGVQRSQADLVVCNSEWIAECHHAFRDRTIICRPPVRAAVYRVPAADHDRRHATILNLQEAKGGPLFWKVARRLPYREFLAVRGAYGVQEIPDVVPPNVTVIDNTPSVVTDVYARTGVLLVPSAYESWGRVAVEAMASGIPVLASATDGLVEALGESAWWINRDDPSAWVDALRRLELDPGLYWRWATAALERSAMLDALAAEDLARWVTAVELTAAGRRPPV